MFLGFLRQRKVILWVLQILDLTTTIMSLFLLAIVVETDPNCGRDLNSKDEEIEGMFNLQLDLPDIEDLFPSSYKESLVDDDVSDFDVHGPFSRMWICHSL